MDSFPKDIGSVETKNFKEPLPEVKTRASCMRSEIMESMKWMDSTYPMWSCGYFEVKKNDTEDPFFTDAAFLVARELYAIFDCVSITTNRLDYYEFKARSNERVDIIMKDTFYIRTTKKIL